MHIYIYIYEQLMKHRDYEVERKQEGSLNGAWRDKQEMGSDTIITLNNKRQNLKIIFKKKQ